MSSLLARVAVTITSGQYVSSAGFFGGRIPNVLQMPAAWDAAAISLATSPDGSNFYYVYDTSGVLVTLPADASRRINLPTTLISGSIGLKIASGTAASPVNQTADRVIYLEVWE